MPWDMVRDWLSTPLSGQAEHLVAPTVAWHGRLMVLSWSILLPLGILVARFFKVTPRQKWPDQLDNTFWWRCHLYLQQAGVALALLAAGLVLLDGPGMPDGPVATAHRLLGWLLLGLGGVQLVGGWLRGTKGGPTVAVFAGDHFDMTRRRILFERAHKGLGWLCMPLALIATALGLVLADAPRWMPLVIGAWWIALIAAFLAMQRRGMCLDTYQAIWGPDPSLPGNRIAPIGWRVTRRGPGREG
ncbi:cytochrome B [Methylobacterium sp. NEAU 140]|uniref:cytochrome B n=1 Tax=Methylobacterium sp. NEAU 140 TaxID=3064945 RepID=UPI002733A5DF|nr:cytochrome B [Methylobacterium sp. NEAU 140]MDP4026433.1 cytochrome B [Methylobacterium sp. NEAU 140]